MPYALAPPIPRGESNKPMSEIELAIQRKKEYNACSTGRRCLFGVLWELLLWLRQFSLHNCRLC